MKKALLLAMVCILGLASCNPLEQPRVAVSVAEQYYETVKAKDFAKSLDYYSPDFFNALKISPEEWQGTLAKLQDKLGELQDYNLVSWKTSTFVGTGAQSGTYYNLDYNVTYSDYVAKEILTLFKPQGAADGDIRIAGHVITSPGLLN